MFCWLTITIDIMAALVFVDDWLHGTWPHWLKVVAVLAVETIVYLLLGLVWSDGSYPLALIAGFLIAMGWDWFICSHQVRFAKACLYLSITAALFPLCLAEEEIWHYSDYQAILMFCIAITPLTVFSRPKEKHRIAQFYANDMVHPWISCLPCVLLIPEVLLILGIRHQTVFSAMIISTVLLLFMVISLLLQKEWMMRMQSDRLNNAMNRWQRESRDYMNTIRSQRHDFNLHLHAISGLIGSGEYEQCAQYVEKLVTEANDVNDIMPICDPIVGSMLYTMREKARQLGTDILYHITYDMADILCNGFECNKIIGNLLQNAMDALQTQEDKDYGIRLSILKRRGNTVIICENRFTGDPNAIARVFDPGFSTKQGHEGIGLSMIMRTTEQYGGRIYPEFEADLIRFVVNIPNKVNLPKGAMSQ